MARGDLDHRSYSFDPAGGIDVLLMFGSAEELVDTSALELRQRIARQLEISEVTQKPASEIVSAPDHLLDFFAETSLFGDRRLLHVSGVTEKMTANVEALLAGPPSANGDLVLMSTSSLRSRSKLIDAVRASPRAAAISCYERGLMRPVIRSKLADLGAERIDEPALDLLTDISASMDPGAFAGLLDQLTLTAPLGQPITRDAVESVAPPDAGSADADLLEAALTGGRAALYRALQARLLDGESASAFLAMLGRALTSALARASSQGGGAKLHWKAEQVLTRALNRRADLPNRLERALTLIHDAERRLRSQGDLERAVVERLVLRASQTLNPA